MSVVRRGFRTNLNVVKSSGQIHMTLSNPDGSNTIAQSIIPLPNAGKFHHVAGTYDGTTIKSYLDGVLVGTAARSGPILTTTSALVISHHGGSCPLRAVAAIMKTGFTPSPPAEILAIFAAGSAGKCKAATGLDHFKCYKAKGKPPNVAVDL